MPVKFEYDAPESARALIVSLAQPTYVQFALPNGWPTAGWTKATALVSWVGKIGGPTVPEGQFISEACAR